MLFTPTSSLNSFLRCHNDMTKLPRCFRHAWPTPSKIVASTYKDFRVYQYTWHQLHNSFLTIMHNCYFEYFRQAWPCPSKIIASSYRKFLMFNYTKIQLLIPHLGHAWPRPPRLIKSTCTKVWCLSTGKKTTSSPPSLHPFFWDIAKTLQTCFFGYFRHV